MSSSSERGLRIGMLRICYIQWRLPEARVLYVQRVPWHPRCAQPVGVGKSAPHAAAEAGHEAVARLLVHADPQAIHARSDALAGRTPLQVGECSSLLTVLTLRT